MQSVYPDFYERFQCRASLCRHSCCRGWEIDVDDGSAAYYLALPGPLGDELRAALREDGEGWHFRLDAEERCPFLRQDGLCRLICALGEDALCDICALHPRFFADCGAYELCGLGLSCEAAAALLLETEAPLYFRLGEERLDLAALLERLGAPLPPGALRYTPETDPARLTALLDALERTEPIDARWPEELAALRSALLPPQSVRFPAELRLPRYDRILAALLYRQLDRLDEVGIETLLGYARCGTDYICLRDTVEGCDAEHLRRWSEQIEYSTENVDILLRTL